MNAAKRALTIAPPIAVFALAYLTSFHESFGYFIDEFYYIACSKRLAFGYVDHPPFSIFVLSLVRGIFGESLAAIRLFPALGAGFLAYLTGLIAKELGGDDYSRFFAALCAGLTPLTLIMFGFYSMNFIEILLWNGIVLLLIKYLSGGDDKLWLWIGVLTGIGVLNKHTFLLFAALTFAALAISGKAKFIKSSWFYWGLAAAAIICLPNLIWQIENGFSSIEFYKNAREFKNVETPPAEAFFMQILFSGPANSIIWIFGLAATLTASKFKPYRALAIAFILIFIAFLLFRSSRPDRIAAAYSFMLAAGWTAISTIDKAKIMKYVKIALPIFSIGVQVALVPLSAPVLSLRQTERFFAEIGLADMQTERSQSQILPVYFIYKLNWRELVDSVAQVCETLDEKEREKSLVAASFYGAAGAIELLGKPRNLPPVVCGHNSYWHWSETLIEQDVEAVVAIGISEETLRYFFEEVKYSGITFTCAKYFKYMNNMKIYICRRPKPNINERWKFAKYYV